MSGKLSASILARLLARVGHYAAQSGST